MAGGNGEAAGSRRADDGARRCVLLVEDDHLEARAMARLLSILSHHIEVVVAERFEVAVRRVAATAPCSWVAAIVDVGLPDGCGLDLTRTLRVMVPGLPVLVTTGGDARELANRAVESDAQFAFKPVSRTALEAFVARAIGNRGDRRVDAAVSALARARGLSKCESRLVRLASQKVRRSRLAAVLGLGENTVKSQIRSLLAKCEAETLDDVVHEILHASLARD